MFYDRTQKELQELDCTEPGVTTFALVLIQELAIISANHFLFCVRDRFAQLWPQKDIVRYVFLTLVMVYVVSHRALKNQLFFSKPIYVGFEDLTGLVYALCVFPQRFFA